MSWLTARCGSRLRIASPGRTTAQVPHRSYAQVPGDFVQPVATGGEKAAEQATLPELLHPYLPALGTTAQPIKNPGQCRRDRGLSVANEPP